jgi:hypothetical protein
MPRMWSQHFGASRLLPRLRCPYPAKEKWDGWGFEYKCEATVLGLPLLHVSFKYRFNRRPVPAKGFIAIGQFACGVRLILTLVV